MLELGSGDSNAITSDFSELSLERRAMTGSSVYEGSGVAAASSLSSSNAAVEARALSMERRCPLFDENYDDDDERYTCVIDNGEEYQGEGVELHR